MIPCVPTVLAEVTGTRHRWHRIRNLLLELCIIFIMLAPETEDYRAKGSDEKLSLLPNAPDLNPQREIKGKHNREPGSQQVSSRRRDRPQRSVRSQGCSEMPPPELLQEACFPKKQGALIFENSGSNSPQFHSVSTLQVIYPPSAAGTVPDTRWWHRNTASKKCPNPTPRSNCPKTWGSLLLCHLCSCSSSSCGSLSIQHRSENFSRSPAAAQVQKGSGFQQGSALRALPVGNAEHQAWLRSGDLIVAAWSSSLKQRGDPEGKRIPISGCDWRWSTNKPRERREAKKESKEMRYCSGVSSTGQPQLSLEACLLCSVA